jgi:cytochrome c oxidase subunit 2
VQKFWGFLFGIVMLGCFLLFVVSPFVPGWWLPRNVSTFGGGIDRLFYLILAITGFFFVLTEAILVVALFKFAHKPGHKGSYVHGNHQLEIFWTLIPGIILFLLALWQVDVWADVKYQSRMPTPDSAALQFEVSARQWEWRVRYPSVERFQSWEADGKLPEAERKYPARDFDRNPHEDDVRLVNEIHCWKGTKETASVLVQLKTQDVLHSFFLPNLRLKQDAVPGKTIPVWFAVTEHNTVPYTDAAGETRWKVIDVDPRTGVAKNPELVWELTCAEFCGVRHSLMRGKLYVHETKPDFLAWLQKAEDENRRTAPAKPAGAVAAR